MTNFELMRNRLLARAGLWTKGPAVGNLGKLFMTEWCEKFELAMRNRLIMGALRYGPLRAKNKPQYDRVGSMKRRLQVYVETGNLEMLVDVANLCLCEFVQSNHPKKHFSADDNGEHVKLL